MPRRPLVPIAVLAIFVGWIAACGSDSEPPAGSVDDSGDDSGFGGSGGQPIDSGATGGTTGDSGPEETGATGGSAGGGGNGGTAGQGSGGNSSGGSAPCTPPDDPGPLSTPMVELTRPDGALYRIDTTEVTIAQYQVFEQSSSPDSAIQSPLCADNGSFELYLTYDAECHPRYASLQCNGQRLRTLRR